MRTTKCCKQHGSSSDWSWWLVYVHRMFDSLFLEIPWSFCTMASTQKPIKHVPTEGGADGGSGGKDSGDALVEAGQCDWNDSEDAPPPEALPPPAMPRERRVPAARARVSGGVPGDGAEGGAPDAAWSDEGGARGSEAAGAGEAVRDVGVAGRGAAAANGKAKAKAGRGTAAGGKGGRAQAAGVGAGVGGQCAGDTALAERGLAEKGHANEGPAEGPSPAAAPARAPRQQPQGQRVQRAGAAGVLERPSGGEPAAAGAAPSDEDGEYAERAVEQRRQARRQRRDAPAPAPQRGRGAAAASAAAPAATKRPAAQGTAAGERGAKPQAQGVAGGARRREPDQAAGEGLEYDMLGLPVVPDLRGRRGARKGGALEEILQGGASAGASREADGAGPVSSMEVSDLSEEDAAAAPVDGRITEEEEEVMAVMQPGGRRTAPAAAKSLPQAPVVCEAPLGSAQPAAGMRRGAEAASGSERRPSKLAPPGGTGATPGDGLGGQPAGAQRKALDWEQFEQDMLRLGEQADALLAEGDFC